MELNEAVRSRRSVRRYRAGARIPRADLEKILTAAMMAPSACNARPWTFIVAESREVLEQIAAVHPYCRHVLQAGTGIVVCAHPSAQAATGGYEFWPQDCGAAIENLLLQARDLGYGTCWCGVYPVPERVEGVSRVLGLDADTVPVAVVTLGVPAETPAARGSYDPAKVKFI